MPNLSIKNNSDGSQASLGLGVLEQIKFNANGSVEIPQLIVAHMIGEPFALLDNLAGVSAPDNSGAARYIKLTAADPYNSGLLSSESVSGSAPLVVATAVISLADSPLNGLTINLWNTERRIPRAGNAGTLEDDAFQNFTGIANFHGSGTATVLQGASGAFQASGLRAQYPAGTATPGADSYDALVINPSAVSRTSTETRPKNQGVTYYMRIK